MLSMYDKQKNNTTRYLFNVLWILIILMLMILVNIRNEREQQIAKTPNYNFQKQYSNANSNFAKFNERLDQALMKASVNKKTILFWNPEHKILMSHNRSLNWKCGSCRVSSNASKIHDAETGAVVVLYKWATPLLMPKKSERRTDQLYVWLTGESISNLIHHRNMNFSYEDRFKFNATMSYRRDSDVYQANSSPSINKIERNLTKLMAKKTRFSVAVVSNCLALPASKIRMQYLIRIRSKIPLDGFGKCFESTLAKTRDKTPLLQLLQKYKFYFAFENSFHCRDYITEKLFLNGIRGNTLPIVMGPSRKDYEAKMPPKSFIHVEDFSSMDKLVDYLKYLNNNDSAYLEHFRWRTRPEISTGVTPKYQASYCQLCRIINGINVDDALNSQYNSSSPPRPLFTPTVSHRTVSSLSKWIKNENKDCLSKNYTLSELGIIQPV